jgi:mono/diheme cytochrome c family protein
VECEELRKAILRSAAALGLIAAIHAATVASQTEDRQEAAAASEAAVASEPADPKVERGRYVATISNCVSCHTRPDGEPFAGGLAMHTPFGTIYSTNITPDDETGIGKWSEEEFGRALREGVRPNGEHLYPAFPYTSFTKIDDADVAALYAYFKSLAPVRYTPPENELSFPANQRWALGIWKALYFEEGRFQPDKNQTPEWNRGAYLVEGLGHCGACHTPRNFLGAEKASLAMTGGEFLDRVPGGDVRTWAAPNLTSADNGLKAWPLEEVAAYLQKGRNRFVDVFGPMNEVFLNSTRHLTDEDARAMATYLKSLPANPGETGKVADAQTLRDGESLYNVHCGTCHQPTGLGGDNMDAGAQLVGSPVVLANSPASLINVILYGPQLPEELPERWRHMDAFGEKLEDDEVALIASYLRGAWGHKASAVTEKQVAAQR